MDSLNEFLAIPTKVLHDQDINTYGTPCGKWATFRPNKLKNHYVAPQFLIFRQTI